MHIVPSITGDRIDSCTFGTFWGTNYVPGKDRNQLQQYLGVPMRCGMDPAILSGVTMHASSSESVWRGKPTWKSSQFPLLSGSRHGGGVVGAIRTCTWWGLFDYAPCVRFSHHTSGWDLNVPRGCELVTAPHTLNMETSILGRLRETGGATCSYR